jgi:CheY-like chemotaxis protein
MNLRPRVLLVDDVPTNVQILAQALGSDAYELFFAMNGPDALRLASQQQPDLILLDVMMPGMDGYHVCGVLKHDPRLQDIPVIFVTAMDEIEYETRGLELGAVDYVAKPFNPGLVRLRVRNQLDLKAQRDTLAARTAELEKAMQDIKLLSGLLPVCAWCRKIRDDAGGWDQLESYISRHSDATFTHVICPDCYRKTMAG